MEKDSSEESIQEIETQHDKRRRKNFSYNKNIDNWKDFQSTWKKVDFSQEHNALNQEALESFWKTQLEILSHEPEKICILVPAQFDKMQVSNQSSLTQEIGDNNKVTEGEIQKEKKENQKINKGQSQKAEHNQQGRPRNSKKEAKNFKPKTQKIKLSEHIVQTAISLLVQYPGLAYSYESLFIGKPKQLLLYRVCSAIERYLQKYRLPNDFNSATQALKSLTEQAYSLKLQKNTAISQFNKGVIPAINKKIQTVNQSIDSETIIIKKYLKNILLDFKSKDKCRQISLLNIREGFIGILKIICKEFQCEVIARYDETDHDQFKDILILKKEDHRVAVRISLPEEEEPEQALTEVKEEKKFIYVKPQRQPETPSDLKELLLKKIDFTKQCYVYSFQFKKSDKYNVPQGLFIRSPFQNNKVYELSINVDSTITKIDVEIYPYQEGKSIYEIYVWNKVGYTKSTQKIIIYNELSINKREKASLELDYYLYLLGQSQSGLIVEKKQQKSQEQDQEMPIDQIYSTDDQFQKASLVGKHVSMCNSALLCDKYGAAASWGSLFFSSGRKQAQDEVFNIIEDGYVQKHMRIQKPFLLSPDKYIRKVSCGNGYCLLLSSFGPMYSMGINHYGQLGLGHFRNESQNMQPREICKFTDRNSPFLVDIVAGFQGSCFAIDDAGNGYRWGLNQVEETKHPVFDHFNSIMNYTTLGINYRQSNPFKISKSYIQGKIRHIQSGNHFYYALTEANVLFGWGQCKYLGCGKLLNPKQIQIVDIVNPIQLRKNVKMISSGPEHSVAITTDNRILAWGKTNHFSIKFSQKQFYVHPTDITQEFGPFQKIKLIKCGKDYTAIVNLDNEIRIIGNKQVFKKEIYILQGKTISDIICNKYQSLIGVLSPKVYPAP